MSPLYVQAFVEFEKMGEPEVRLLLETEALHVMKQGPARAWLALQDAKTRARAEERAEENTLISKQALKNSQYAIVISIVAIAVTLFL